MNEKKGFLLYFDSWPMVMDLPMEQRGLLLTALYQYAQRVWREDSVTIDEMTEDCPGMAPQTRMACRFMGVYILRDTRRWLSQQQSRSRRRQEEGGRPRPSPAESEEEKGVRVREDMDRIKRLMDRVQGER